MQELISIENISKRGNEGKDILVDINAKIFEGELITIIGPSGSGKSTLLSLLNRMNEPDKGILKYKGKPYPEIDILFLRRKIGMVFQLPTMIKGTVRDNIILGPKLHNEIIEEQEIDAWLNKVGLATEIKYQDARTLSGGQKQKVSLARALANKSEILLLDEVTASLDPDSTMEIEELVQSLHNEKKTILWVTHNIEQAKKIGQYTWVLSEGRFVEQGKSYELFTNPKQEITKRYIQV